MVMNFIFSFLLYLNVFLFSDDPWSQKSQHIKKSCLACSPKVFLFHNDTYIRKIKSKNVWVQVTIKTLFTQTKSTIGLYKIKSSYDGVMVLSTKTAKNILLKATDSLWPADNKSQKWSITYQLVLGFFNLFYNWHSYTLESCALFILWEYLQFCTNWWIAK